MRASENERATTSPHPEPKILFSKTLVTARIIAIPEGSSRKIRESYQTGAVYIHTVALIWKTQRNTCSIGTGTRQLPLLQMFLTISGWRVLGVSESSCVTCFYTQTHSPTIGVCVAGQFVVLLVRWLSGLGFRFTDNSGN